MFSIESETYGPGARGQHQNLNISELDFQKCPPLPWKSYIDGWPPFMTRQQEP